MDNSQFIIDVLDFYWINNEKDDPSDLCLHGDVFARIGEEVVADNYPCTVSSTALYLLKSLESNHVYGENANQMLPCCGFFIIPDENTDTIEISGCPNGIDWSVLHMNNSVKLVTEQGTEVILELNIYKKIVFDFADKVENYYKQCQDKIIPEDEFDYNGYIKFWKEWNNRRNKL